MGFPRVELSFRQLSEYDDLINDVIVDRVLELETVKVNPHYRSKVVDEAQVIQALRKLIVSKDIETNAEYLIQNAEWAKSYLARKTPDQIAGFKVKKKSTFFSLSLIFQKEIKIINFSFFFFF